MKKLYLLTLLLTVVCYAKSQTITSINYYKWSDPITYELSPEPYIAGYGYYSDSLSSVYENKDFFEYNDEYYCIENWADYYYWYTKKYWQLFDNPAIYEYYYWTKNDLGMASYIASNDFHGQYYPSAIKLVFPDETIPNRLSSDKYIAQNENQIKRLNNQKRYPDISREPNDFHKKPIGYSQHGVKTNYTNNSKIKTTTNTRAQTTTNSNSTVTRGKRTLSKKTK